MKVLAFSPTSPLLGHTLLFIFEIQYFHVKKSEMYHIETKLSPSTYEQLEVRRSSVQGLKGKTQGKDKHPLRRQ